MIPAFAFFPPEINSALMYGGAGSGPLFTAASAWDMLAAELADAAASFQAVITQLVAGAWSGPSSAAMVAAAERYVEWLNVAAAQAAAASTQANWAASEFEAAFAATVPTPQVIENRIRLMVLIATNFLGQNSTAIAMTELEYGEMWAQDVAAMLGYQAGATSVAATLPAFTAAPVGLAGLAGLVTTPLAELVSQFAGALSSAGVSLFPQLQSVFMALSPAISTVTSLMSTASAPVSTLTSVAQVGLLPATALMSPMVAAAQGSAQGAPTLAGATAATSAASAVEAPLAAGSAVYALQPIAAGGGGGLSALGAASAGIGTARFVGPIAVPPAWPGAMPAYLPTPAIAGVAVSPTAAGAAGAVGAAGGTPVTAMPMSRRGAPEGEDREVVGRGPGGRHVVQQRPRVVPRSKRG
ncbi:hypothetical protein A5714_04970 [Mycobacterium sp. E2462]|uniref:PPE family protein n=1 Tax=Mycobacterium sp. E2462 TaxID=1834133 RepID=UPI0008002A48|nr:PPE family protein [Mycobacterium sp. E2462]OBI02708.1 hypothetical protein A5714_04970 [Mycobacterium sp. E2462]